MNSNSTDISVESPEIIAVVITSLFLIGIMSWCSLCLVVHCLRQLRNPVYLPITNIFEIAQEEMTPKSSLLKHNRKSRRQVKIKSPKSSLLYNTRKKFSLNTKVSSKSLQLGLISHAGMFNFKKAYEVNNSNVETTNLAEHETFSENVERKSKSLPYKKPELELLEFVDV